MAGALLEEDVPGAVITTSGTHVIEPPSWVRSAEAVLGLAVLGERDNGTSLARGAGSHGEAGL